MAARVLQKYGYDFPVNPELPLQDNWLQVEMSCIKSNLGPDLATHYEAMRRIIWPELATHRWHDLCLKEIRRPKATVTVLMGPGSTGKTHESGWNYLCEYLVFPEDTCILVSSTTIPSLQLRVWGEMTMLWQRARDRFPWLPGHLLEHRIAITTDSLEDGDFEERRVRDMRKAIVGVPCVVGNKVLGLSKYQGIKQKRMRLIADEAAAMSGNFLSAFSNLNDNEDFQAIVIGNPNDISDPLGKAAEPKDGWSAHMEPTRTEVWDTRFMDGRCINLVGTDSPNFDYPADKPSRFKFLIDRQRIAMIEKTFGRESFEYYSQAKGVMRISQFSSRVLTREICNKGGAFGEVNWQDTRRTRIAGLDSAWGGDRCVFTWIEFGHAADGQEVIRCNVPEIVPITKQPNVDADYVIAQWCKARCEALNIPAENFFHDSTGRGSLGTALARVWSSACNPVEFGGQPTDRPVTQDYWCQDPMTKAMRLKLCSEHYIKFVTEMWFSVRYCVEAGQLRNLSEEVFEEFSLRNWKRSKDDKIELEPKSGTQEKPGMKQRTGRSPDLADSLSICIEGARRKGFQIAKLGNEVVALLSTEWMRDLAEKRKRFENRANLVEVS